MLLDRLMATFSIETFLREFFLRRPFSLPHAASSFMPLANWSVVDTLLSRPEADVWVVRDGQRVGVDRPGVEEYYRQFAEGCTLLIRHAERHDERLRQLANEFRQDFAAPVDVHVYCTPAGRHGFGWHYDAEDVFILQTVGCKNYSLRKNTVNPWPLAETLPADMRYEREIMPLMGCRLEAGDWLYLPHGYWHRGESISDAISLAVGLMMPSAIDLFDFLRDELVQSPLWRQRLPVHAGSDPAAVLSAYRNRLGELRNDLDRILCDERFLHSWILSREDNDQQEH